MRFEVQRRNTLSSQDGELDGLNSIAACQDYTGAIERSRLRYSSNAGESESR